MKISLPGGLSASRFMREYWQKKPLLVRGAFAPFDEPFRPADVLALAQREDAEARLVTRSARTWALDYGPFSRAALRRLPARDWTILVQDTQHFSTAAEALLQRFSFIPQARIDDVMVSLAAPGGGVGPHFDSYDVFLIQGSGRRRWRISAQPDLALRAGLPLKILRNFKPEQAWVLTSGDMLYLPPGYAHDGVALDQCLTYSVGFRAPANQELGGAFLDYLRDTLELPGQYADPQLRPTAQAGEIPAPMLRAMQHTLQGIRWNRAGMTEFIGRFLSEPKSHVFFDPPTRPLSLARFAAACRKGVTLDPRTRCLYAGNHLFINGESCVTPAADASLLRALADFRTLRDARPGPAATALLLQWYRAGYLHLEN